MPFIALQMYSFSWPTDALSKNLTATMFAWVTKWLTPYFRDVIHEWSLIIYLVRAWDKFRDGTSCRAEKMGRGSGLLLLLLKSVSAQVHHPGHVMHWRRPLAVRGQQGRGSTQRVERWIAVGVVEDLKPKTRVSALSWKLSNIVREVTTKNSFLKS